MLEELIAGNGSTLFEGPDSLLAKWLHIAYLLSVSGLLGAIISVLYRASRKSSDRERRLPSTLVLLAMLITMVTIAVGENVAVAFTLVGTLAIVRFRTAVSDIRDTVFVIFAVAAGISVGNDNMTVGFIGTLVVGVGVLILRVFAIPEGGDSPRENAILRLDVSPPSADDSLYASVLQEYKILHRLEDSRVDRERLRLTIALQQVPRKEQAHLLTALIERPEIVSANLDFQ